MPGARQAAEDLVQVDLGPAGLRVLAILPVDDEDSQSCPIRLARASSTPFTKRALGTLP